LKFLNKISFNRGGADSAGEALGAAEALGETDEAGEVFGDVPGDGDAIASGAPAVDVRVPAKVADGACPRAMTTQATLAEIRRVAFIKVTSSSKPTRCRLMSARIARVPIDFARHIHHDRQNDEERNRTHE